MLVSTKAVVCAVFIFVVIGAIVVAVSPSMADVGPINKSMKNALLIFSSICVDILIISMFIYWVLWGRSWRIVFALTIFYTFRSIVQVKRFNFRHYSK